MARERHDLFNIVALVSDVFRIYICIRAAAALVCVFDCRAMYTSCVFLCFLRERESGSMAKNQTTRFFLDLCVCVCVCGTRVDCIVSDSHTLTHFILLLSLSSYHLYIRTWFCCCCCCFRFPYFFITALCHGIHSHQLGCTKNSTRIRPGLDRRLLLPQLGGPYEQNFVLCVFAVGLVQKRRKRKTPCPAHLIVLFLLVVSFPFFVCTSNPPHCSVLSFSSWRGYKTQTTVTYFLIDLVWVAWVPICVKSPDVIIKVRSQQQK
jgi:hypothetical protein